MLTHGPLGEVDLAFKSSTKIGLSDLVFFSCLGCQYFGVGGLDMDDHLTNNPTLFKRSDPVGNGKRLIIARDS